jgi:hypothetical protein
VGVLVVIAFIAFRRLRLPRYSSTPLKRLTDCLTKYPFVWYDIGVPKGTKEGNMVKNENVYGVKAEEFGVWYPVKGPVVVRRGNRFCVIDDSDSVLWWLTDKQTEYLNKLVMGYGLDVIVSVSEDRVKIRFESGEELHIWRGGNVTGTALT